MAWMSFKRSTEKRAFVIANGASRKKQDLELYRDHCHGCNALYRDFEPDELIVTKPEILEELSNTNFPKEKIIVPDWEQDESSYHYCPYPRQRNHAPFSAITKAVMDGYEEIVVVGWDFLPATNKTVRNIYDGTNGYNKKEEDVLPETESRVDERPVSIRRCDYMSFLLRRLGTCVVLFTIPNSSKGTHLNPIFYRYVDACDFKDLGDMMEEETWYKEKHKESREIISEVKEFVDEQLQARSKKPK
jgi:hypothetical protein